MPSASSAGVVQLQRLSEETHMRMCDAIVRTAGMVNLQSLAEMIGLPIQGDNSKDCRPQFVTQLELAMMIGNEGFHKFHFGLKGSMPEGFINDPAKHASAGQYFFEGVTDEDFFGPIYVPFIKKSKADIASRALALEVPFNMTWSCYRGGAKQCGRCGTCTERLEAIDIAVRKSVAPMAREDLIEDPDLTVYEDTEFWRIAVNK